LVRFITPCNHFSQMAILHLDDLIRGISMKQKVTRSTQLLACH
jgi:hypothetical protein